MLEAAGFFGGHGCVGRVLLEEVDRPLHIRKQQASQVATDSMTDKDSLDHQILAVGRHRIGRHLPATGSQHAGEVV